MILRQLELKLWDCADVLRGELSPTQYMGYIFGMLFLKRFNDEFDEERTARFNEFKNEGMAEEDIEELLEDPSIYETFFIPKQARWDKLKTLI